MVPSGLVFEAGNGSGVAPLTVAPVHGGFGGPTVKFVRLGWIASAGR